LTDKRNSKKQKKILFIIVLWIFLATVVTAVTSGGAPFDLTITGNNNYRPLTLTEKVITDEWAKKISTNNNNLPKEPIITNQQQGLSSRISSIRLTVSRLSF
jgi:hypothetical protein